MPGASAAATRSVSKSVTGTMSDSISWKPSSRLASTASERLSLAGARTVRTTGGLPSGAETIDRRDMMSFASQTPDQLLAGI
jgi:hypothetical protein